MILTAFAQMIALDAKTGKPVPTFGKDGRIDLGGGLRRSVHPNYYTMTSPPVIVRGVIVVGSSCSSWWGMRSPARRCRGFDIGTGRLLWTFHTVAQGDGAPAPRPGKRKCWKEAGNANVWAPMSGGRGARLRLSAVSTPTNDYYGGHRPGNELCTRACVCLDVTTGKKVWHYQLIITACGITIRRLHRI